MKPSMGGRTGRGKVLEQTTDLERVYKVEKGLIDRGEGEGRGSDEGG
jgi:hypothetical protein